VELILFGMILPWVLLAVSCWLGWQLLRQGGRILLRLEAIEERMAALNLGSQAAPPQQPELPIGSAAPDFALPDLQENMLSLAHWRGRKIVLVFFSPQCGFCTNMLADLAEMPARANESAPHLVFVTSGGVEQNRVIFQEAGVRCTILHQLGTDVSQRYQCAGTPMGYLIDEGGLIASPRLAGADALLPLLADGAPKVNGTDRGKENKGLAHSRLKRDGLAPGTPAPNFTLPSVAGGEITLEQYRGRPVLLVFSDPHCGPCDQLAPRLQELHRQHAGLQVLMVSRGESEPNRSKVAALGLTFPVALQKQWEISRLYAKFATPAGYLIDAEGLIVKEVAVGVDAIVGLAADSPGVTAASRAI
jgi:peroxiredoxin